MRYFISLFLLTFIIAPAALAKKITTTGELIQALQTKYAKSWYKTATFVQKTTNIDKDGNKKIEIWHEALSVPGSLRIDFTPTKDVTEFYLRTAKSIHSKTARSKVTGRSCIP